MTQENTLPEYEKDLGERIEGFNKELMPLMAKFELQLSVSLGFSGDGRVIGAPVVVSSRKDPSAKKQEEPTPLAEG